MSDQVDYKPDWPNEDSQCKNCSSCQSHDNKIACVPEGKTFEQALKEYGEISPAGHCNYFKSK